MMIIQTEKIKIRWNPRNKNFYTSKGYTFTKMRDEFEVSYYDLPETSHQDILCKCDFCGKEFLHPYFRIANHDVTGCCNCISKTIEHNMMKKHGVKSPFQLPHVKEKIAKTNTERYGAPNVFGSKQIREQMEQNNIKKYGVPYPVMTSEIRNKIEKTNQERYGGASPFSSEEVRNKSQQTNIERYNVPYATQSKSIQQKMHETFINNEQNHASKEQKHYAKLFNGTLDYPVCACFLDIAFINKKIYIECDFGGHFVYSKIKGLNELEMLFKDAKRDKPILAQGWKCIRYLNRGNNFPNDHDMLILNFKLMSILQSTSVTRILVYLNNRIIRFEPSFVVKSLDLFL